MKQEKNGGHTRPDNKNLSDQELKTLVEKVYTLLKQDLQRTRERLGKR